MKQGSFEDIHAAACPRRPSLDTQLHHVVPSTRTATATTNSWRQGPEWDENRSSTWAVHSPLSARAPCHQRVGRWFSSSTPRATPATAGNAPGHQSHAPRGPSTSQRTATTTGWNRPFGRRLERCECTFPIGELRRGAGEWVSVVIPGGSRISRPPADPPRLGSDISNITAGQ